MARQAIWELIEPRREFQIGEGVAWNEWEASMTGNASKFSSFDVTSAAARGLEAYGRLYTRVEDRPYTKSELVSFLYQVCEKYGIDKTVAYNQITQESSFRPDAMGAFCVLGKLNRKCAAGIAQFIPGTAQRYGMRVNRETDERLDPIKSLGAYGAYMSDLLKMFGGDYLKALAGYNAGEGAVQKAVQRNGEGWLASMPSETKMYIVKILGPRAVSDPAVLASIEQNVDKSDSTSIPILDVLTSDLGPDLIKRWALFVAALVILFIALLPAVLRVYKEVKPVV
jgi:Transglycosylase SLT domain